MKVLVADDHELVRSSLVDLLTTASIATAICESSNAMETIVQIDGQDFDLILVDLFMPGASGFDLVRKVCSEQIDAKIIVLSASLDVAHMRKALSLGASGYIPKSVGTAVMLSAIQLVISGGVYIPEELLKLSITDPSEMISKTDNGNQRPQLSNRQRQVLNCLVQGMSNKEIARELNLSEHTTKTHVATVFKILGVSNRTKAANLARELGMIDG